MRGANVHHRNGSFGRRERIDNPHLVGDRVDVDDFADITMKTLERAFRRLGVEGARRHVMCGEVVKQGAGDAAWAWLAVPQKDPTTVLDFLTRRIAPMLLYLLAIPTVLVRLFGRRPIRYPVAEVQWDRDHARRQI